MTVSVDKLLSDICEDIPEDKPMTSVVDDPSKSLQLWPEFDPDRLSNKEASTAVKRYRIFQPNTDRALYERQEQEPEFEWWAFQAYLSMGINRTMSGCARYMKELNKELKLSHSALRSRLTDIARIWGWSDRTKAFDAQVALARAADNQSEIEQMNDRQAGAALMLLSLCVRELNKYERASDQSLEPVMTIQAVQKGLQIAAAMERMARGEPTSILQTQTGQSNEINQQRMRELLSKPESVDLLDQFASLMDTDGHLGGDVPKSGAN